MDDSGIIDDVNHLSGKLDDILDMPRPGWIYIVPVPYTLPFPTHFVYPERKISPEDKTYAAYVKVGNVWFNEKTRRYRHLEDQEKEKNILVGAKLRPFLVLRKMPSEKINKLTNHVAGLYITKVKPWMKADDLARLRANQSKHLHYLKPSRNPNAGLRFESIVMVGNPFLLPAEFFTFEIGHISQDDWGMIRGKMRDFMTPPDFKTIQTQRPNL